jgi:2Fe-2S ferredoxin
MKIHVIDQKGVAHTIEGTVGWTAMEAIRDANLPIKAECGGTCSCATCHVYVEESWLSRLAPRSEMETEMLDLAFEVKEGSRLSCQITLSPALEGLTLTLAPGTE